MYLAALGYKNVYGVNVSEVNFINILLKKMELKIVEKTHVPGKFGAQFLEEKVDLTIADVAFFICPMTMHEIMSVADAGKIVPPKSTFFDPKPIDGLVTLLMKE